MPPSAQTKRGLRNYWCLFTASYCGPLRALGGPPPGRPGSDAQFAVRTGVTVLYLVQLEGRLNVRRVRGREREGRRQCQAQSDAGVASVGGGLRTADCLPKRSFANAAEFAEYFQHEETLIFDGVEQRIQSPGTTRPKTTTTREKKCHTLKAVTLSTPARKLLYVSPCWVGKTHD